MRINVGIGFVTGRKHFQNVLRSYINNWLEHGLIRDPNVRFHLFVAYDLKYHNTDVSDYKNIPVELAAMVDSINFFDATTVENELSALIEQNVLTRHEGKAIFGEGYGKKRNVVTYFAIKKKMDRLIFIDDDEYPLATFKNETGKLLWMGQSVVGTHLKYISGANITHGHHCGYISPIPFIRFDDQLTEAKFKDFIDAVSNDIISWEKIKDLSQNHKGVTYANPKIINKALFHEVVEEEGMKFISGANLCFNLTDPINLPPFYNPPGARGEDTFMSTALTDLKVIKVPCYTFHDGFSAYHNLLNGVLPVDLEAVDSSSEFVRKRFLNAAIGWIRYKPLLVYITNRHRFDKMMLDIELKLTRSIPSLNAYFNTSDFQKVLSEFLHYRKNVAKHYREFELTKTVWKSLLHQVSVKSNEI